MKLNISVKADAHSEICTAVSWSPDAQLLSCSDDKVLSKWGADGEALGKVATLSVYTTSISWCPATGKQAPDIVALSCTDGSFRFVSRSGREEKKVAAHEGAVIVVRWSHDGAALLTGGEDGEVKIWSKSGNFRSTLASTGQSVYAACWGPDDDQVLYASGKLLLVKSVQATKKSVQWSAHDGIVLCVDWNVANNLIVSGGEDCTYRVWDAYGRQLFSSRPMENFVTSVGWCPNGECMAVGSHNLLRLCDKTGWTHSRERLPTAGSILNIAWTTDGTQFAAAGGSGAVVFATVVERRLEWKNAEVTLLEPRKIRVQDVANETLEDLEYARDRVVEVGLGFDMLVVTTTTQCFVYSLGNLNTPIIFDIKAPPHFVRLCRRHFLTLDSIAGLQVISYEGRVLCSPRFQGMRAEFVTRDTAALAPDTVCVVDCVDAKIIQILDATSGRQLSKLVHSSEVTFVTLNQHSLGPQERLLAFTDKNRDLYLAAPHSASPSGTGGPKDAPVIPTMKLHSHVESALFNDETDVLVGLADGRLKVWYQPAVAFVDRDLLPLTSALGEATSQSEYGRGAVVQAHTGSRVTVRKADGSVTFSATSLDVPLLYEYCRAGRWDEGTRLCRHQKSPLLWACLAGLALAKKQLDAAEMGLAQIDEVAKVSQSVWLFVCLFVCFSVSVCLCFSAFCSFLTRLSSFASDSLPPLPPLPSPSSPLPPPPPTRWSTFKASRPSPQRRAGRQSLPSSAASRTRPSASCCKPLRPSSTGPSSSTCACTAGPGPWT